MYIWSDEHDHQYTAAIKPGTMEIPLHVKNMPDILRKTSTYFVVHLKYPPISAVHHKYSLVFAVNFFLNSTVSAVHLKHTALFADPLKYPAVFTVT